MLESFAKAFQKESILYCESMGYKDALMLAEKPQFFKITDIESTISVRNELLMDAEEDSSAKMLIIFINDSDLEKITETINMTFRTEFLLLVRSGIDFLRCSLSFPNAIIQQWVKEICETYKVIASHTEHVHKHSISTQGCRENCDGSDITFNVISSPPDSDILQWLLCRSSSVTETLNWLNSAVIMDRLIEPYTSEDNYDICFLQAVSVLLSCRNVREVPSLRAKCTEFLNKVLRSKYFTQALFSRIIELSIFERFCTSSTFLLIRTVLQVLRLAKSFCPDLAEAGYDDFVCILKKIPRSFWAFIDYERLTEVATKFAEVEVCYKIVLMEDIHESWLLSLFPHV